MWSIIIHSELVNGESCFQTEMKATNLVSSTVCLNPDHLDGRTEPVTAPSTLCLNPWPASPCFKIVEWFFWGFSWSKLNIQEAFPGYPVYKCFLWTWKWNLKGICLCSWEIQMFSTARPALFMKPESQGRDCVHLSVNCCTLLMPPCHVSFYLAAHQPPKSLYVYIIVLLGGDVWQNVLHFPYLHFTRGTKTLSLVARACVNSGWLPSIFHI